jgi:hypothetical protein
LSPDSPRINTASTNPPWATSEPKETPAEIEARKKEEAEKKRKLAEMPWFFGDVDRKAAVYTSVYDLTGI